MSKETEHSLSVSIPTATDQSEDSERSSCCEWKKCSLMKSSRRLKLAVVFSLLGLVMLVMGGIVHVEKSALEAEGTPTGNADYTFIAGNALLALGATFLLLAILQVGCCCVEAYCLSSEDEERGRRRFRMALFSRRDVTAAGNPPYSTVVTVCELTEYPPKYSDVIKNDEEPPPRYDEIIEQTSRHSATSNPL